jgi:CRISPR-associated protein Csx10
MSELVLNLRQPAQVGDKARSDFVLGTHHYLPGSAVRGAFAASWIAAHGTPAMGSPARDEFVRLFEGEVRFGPLFADAEFVPLSVISHKYQPTGECPVVEYDRALDENVPARCPECKSPLEQTKGLRGAAIRVQRRTSVAISSTGVARRGQIVTRDTLTAGQSFRGTLVAADPDLLATLVQLGPIRIGGRRTTHGAAEVQIRPNDPLPSAQRRQDGRLVVRLRSPGVFVDKQGRPSRDPAPWELEDVLGCPARVAQRWTRWHTAGGWHIASGLPKPVELAVAPGSTYLIETEGQPTDAALAELGRRGLGLRRHEGFGDLAPAPVLTPGRLAREIETQRRQRLLHAVAPLRGLAVTRPEIWPKLLAELEAHAAGNEVATGFLRRMAQSVDQPTARAITDFLGWSSADATYVTEDLRES